MHQAISTQPTLQPSGAVHLVEEIRHRVYNEYMVAISMLSHAAAADIDEPTRDVLRSLSCRLRAFAEAHHVLQPPLTREVISLADYVEQLCARVTDAHLADRCISLEVTADEVWLNSDRCWRVGLILSELITNAVRHGLGGKPGVIRIEIADHEGQVGCYVDNGGRACPGLPGRGTRITQKLATELGGSIEWSFRQGGCTACLEFPRLRPKPSARPLFESRN